MKLVTKEDLENHDKATVRGMAQGFVSGLAVSTVGFYALQRRSAYYRRLPITIKMLGFVLVIAPCVTVQAERSGLRYDMQHNWVGAGKREMDIEEREAHERWLSLSPKQKAVDWALRYRWHLFLAGWATTMGVSWMILQRNKTQTFAQKIVQARMYAQGIALAGLLGGASLSQMQPARMKKDKMADHSWARLLEQQAVEVQEIGHPRTAHATAVHH